MEGRDFGTSAGGSGFAGMVPPAIEIAGVAAVVAILGAKIFLAGRINVSWDEFYYLSHVYALGRGELDLLLQGAYAHAFGWITATGGNEVDQVVRLRLLMCVLLAVSAWLIYALARLFASRAAAIVALLAWLSAWPVMKHGASFRADAMLLPLTLAAFWLALRDGRARHREAVLAGASYGLAFAVTVKAVLLLPALAAAFLLRRNAGVTGARHRAGELPVIALMFGTSAAVAALLLALHATQVVAGTEQAGAFASRSFAESIADVPFLPRGDVTRVMVAADPLYWIAAAAGLLLAIRSRAWGCAALALALMPLLFYRNAFPYFFPVMMAPAAVLIAVAADRLLAAGPPPWRGIRLAILAIATLVLISVAWSATMALRFDEQGGQRAVVDAVHRIFPRPVPYIDHSGMIASYPKVGFFMSSWGVEAYLRRGNDFMPTLANRCPPLVLANHPVLVSGSLLNRQLREEDRRLLKERYVDYWGPIRVAGAALAVAPGTHATVRVPCTGLYRLETGSPVVLDGIARSDGDVIELAGERDYILAAPAERTGEPQVRLLWAEARPPPDAPPPAAPLYLPL